MSVKRRHKIGSYVQHSGRVYEVLCYAQTGKDPDEIELWTEDICTFKRLAFDEKEQKDVKRVEPKPKEHQ